MTKLASVVPLPGTNPNCDSPIVTTCLMRLWAILLLTFIACYANFSPLKLPQSRAYNPFPCKGRRNEALLPVSGDLPISNDCYGEVTDHVSTCIICCSDHIHHYPDGPAALPNLNLEMTFFTISMVIGIGGPSSGVHQIDGQDPTQILH